MREPHIHVGVLAASGSQRSALVPLVRARSLHITGRATYNASATGTVEVEVYYSPDGTNLDTISYGTLTLSLSAGNTVQRSAVVVVPEHGYVQFRLVNNDSTYTATDARVWYSVQSWPREEKTPSRGALAHDTGEDTGIA